jgi:hypothetical protein
MPQADSLSHQVWDQVYRAIQKEKGTSQIIQGVVSDRDATKRVIWVRDLSSDPIRVVGQSQELVYYSGSQRKVTKVLPAIPEKGDVVLLIRTVSDAFRCIGVVTPAAEWTVPGSVGFVDEVHFANNALLYSKLSDTDGVVRFTTAALNQWPYMMFTPNEDPGAGGGSGLALQSDKNGGGSYELYAWDGHRGLHMYKSGVGDLIVIDEDAGGSGKPGIKFGDLQDTNIYRAMADVIKTDDSLAIGGYGTSLPASPVDGQLFVLVDSVTSPTYQWQFRYNAGSSLTHKWEFVGGPPLYNEVTQTWFTTSTTYSVPDTVGNWPNVALPRAGDYMVTIASNIYQTTGGTGFLSYDIGATGAVDADSISTSVLVAGNYVTRTRRKAGLSAVTLTMKGRTTANQVNAGSTSISVVPIRVS